MAAWVKSKYPGLRFREHPTRTTGAGRSKRPLRYYTMTYKWQGKTISEALGWEGDFVHNEDEAFDIFRELKQNRKNQIPPFTLKERNALRETHNIADELKKKLERVKALPFDEIFLKRYYPYIENNRRNQKVVKTEKALYSLWIKPVIGSLPLSKIAQIPHIETIKSKMKKAGKSPRTIRYALDVTRQVFNYADAENLYNGRNPAAGRRVKRPHEDNRRNRSLSPIESKTLLVALKKRSIDIHDISLLSLHAGLRFGEIATLKWGDVDSFSGQGHLKDTKSNKNRPFFFSTEVKTMFALRQSKGMSPYQLVFPDQNGNQIQKISKTFGRVVDKLFNAGIEDRRERVVFHTLRRTFATWLLNQGTSIYHIQKLLGHASIITTTRYLDTDNDVLKDAVVKLQNNS